MLVVLFLIITIVTGYIYYNTEYSSYRYDSVCNSSESIEKMCVLKINIPYDYPAGSFIYLGLKNFRQTFARFMNSISYDQLDGVSLNKHQTHCDPVFTNEDMGVTTSYLSGKTLNPKATSIPCGLLAKYLPNDTFTIKKGSKTIGITTQDIVYPGLMGHMFKNPDPENSWMNPQNGIFLEIYKKLERFINWARPSSMPHFIKLWAKTTEPIKKGNDYQVFVNNGNQILVVKINRFQY